MQGFSQEKPSKEDFLNEISEQLFEKHKFVNLRNETLKIDLSLYKITPLDRNSLIGLHSAQQLIKPNLRTIDSVLLELKEAMVADTGTEVWNCEKLNKVVCIDSVGEKEILGKANSSWIVGDWSDEEIKNMLVKNPYSNYTSTRWSKSKADSAYEAKQKLSYEEKTYYSVSKPYFIRNYTYALILNEGRTGDQAGGSTVVCERKGNKWKITNYGHWSVN